MMPAPYSWRPLVVHCPGAPQDVGVVDLDGGRLAVWWAKDGEIDEVESRGGHLYVVPHGWRLDPVTRRRSYARAVRAAADAAHARRQEHPSQELRLSPALVSR